MKLTRENRMRLTRPRTADLHEGALSMSIMGRAGTLLVMLVACARDVPAPAVPTPSAVTTPSTGAPTAPSVRALVPPRFPPPASAVLLPPVPPLEPGVMDHAEQFGWSRDGSSLGYCFSNPGGLQCELVTRDGQHDHFDDGFSAKGRVDPVRRAALKTRLAQAALAVPNAPSWRYADIELTWSVTLGAQDAHLPVPGVLHVGGRISGESPVFHIALSDATAGGFHDRIHPETISLSEDGEYLGVIAHAFAGEYSDSFPMTVVPVDELAAHVYNDTGLAHHKRGDFARAAELFKRATFANEGFALGAYNLACADARLASPETEAALALAIARGGEDARTRAGADADFDGVRAAPWFQKLVPP